MVNSIATSTAGEGIVPLGSIVRRYGCALTGNDNAVTITECGYYQIDFNITYTGTAGTSTFEIQQNGVTVKGATASQTIGTADTEIHSATISAMIRVLRSDVPTFITVLNNGVAVNITNSALRVIKE